MQRAEAGARCCWIFQRLASSSSAQRATDFYPFPDSGSVHRPTRQICILKFVLHEHELAIVGCEYCGTACKHACSLAQSSPSCQSSARGRSPALCDAVPQELVTLLPGGTLATLEGPGRGKQGCRSPFTGTHEFRVQDAPACSIQCELQLMQA